MRQTALSFVKTGILYAVGNPARTFLTTIVAANVAVAGIELLRHHDATCGIHRTTWVKKTYNDYFPPGSKKTIISETALLLSTAVIGGSEIGAAAANDLRDLGVCRPTELSQRNSRLTAG